MIRRLLVVPLAIVLMPIMGFVLLLWVIWSAFYWLITGNNVLDDLLLKTTVIDTVLAPLDWAIKK